MVIQYLWDLGNCVCYQVYCCERGDETLVWVWVVICFRVTAVPYDTLHPVTVPQQAEAHSHHTNMLLVTWQAWKPPMVCQENKHSLWVCDEHHKCLWENHFLWCWFPLGWWDTSAFLSVAHFMTCVYTYFAYFIFISRFHIKMNISFLSHASE